MEVQRVTKDMAEKGFNNGFMTTISKSFMKEDDYIPKGLLASQPALPFVGQGFGQFRPYESLPAYIVLSDPKCMPVRQSTHAAGFDLVAAKDVVVPSRGSAIVSVGMSIALPRGHYGRVAGRSSLAFDHDITVFEGTIDEDYRGPVKVKMFNHSDTDYKTSALSRIAQLIIEPYTVPRVLNVVSLPETDRGTGGFGSTDSI